MNNFGNPCAQLLKIGFKKKKPLQGFEMNNSVNVGWEEQNEKELLSPFVLQYLLLITRADQVLSHSILATWAQEWAECLLVMIMKRQKCSRRPADHPWICPLLIKAWHYISSHTKLIQPGYSFLRNTAAQLVIRSEEWTVSPSSLTVRGFKEGMWSRWVPLIIMKYFLCKLSCPFSWKAGLS